ncbi:MAG: Gfo/Idh/MocA family oxidoreductase [Gammaproteobacteria bacterium]
MSYRTALANFVTAVKTGVAAAPDLEDGLRCLEVIDAAERSARESVRVHLNDRGKR